MPSRIYTIGHSTRSADEFLALLSAHGITRLADIRTVPRSRRHPHFSADALKEILNQAGIEYRHFPELGGLRRPKADSTNTAWRNASFRGYADHMASAAFDEGFRGLLAFAEEAPTTVMCAEAVWWRCHRALLSDAFDIRGVDVFHIESKKPPRRHQRTEFARELDGRPVYPGLL